MRSRTLLSLAVWGSLVASASVARALPTATVASTATTQRAAQPTTSRALPGAAAGRGSGATGRADGRLFRLKQPGERSNAFFRRAAAEIVANGSTEGKALAPEARASLERLARAAGYRAIRNLVVKGGVKGSKSGGGYVPYYRDGWNRNNSFLHANPLLLPAAPSPPGAGEVKPIGRGDPGLETEIRTILAKSEVGRETLARLDRSGVRLRFQDTGGTFNDHASRCLLLSQKNGDGTTKPLSWHVLSVVHEMAHAIDDRRGSTPSIVAPRYEEFAAYKAKGLPVPLALRKSMLAARRDYVTRQISGEARAMTEEVVARRELEAAGVGFGAIASSLRDVFAKEYERVYAAAGVKPEAAGGPAERTSLP